MNDSPPDRQSTHRLRVVLVDDFADVRQLVRRELEDSGLFEVVAEGEDGDEALVLAYRHRPDLMLLDTSMPNMDGLEALPAVRALCPTTAVVMFTGFEDLRLAARARELGAAAFLDKSTPLDELAGRLSGLFAAGQKHAPAGSSSHVRDKRAAPDKLSAREGQHVLDEHIASFRELFDDAAIGMATLTLAGRIVRANQALAHLFDATPAELIGVDYGQLAQGRGPDLDLGLESISNGGELAMFEHAVTFDGQVPGTVLVTLAPIRDRKGHILYVFAQDQDISDQRSAEERLRRSEERFRLLVSAVGEYAIFMLDVDGNVATWNAGAAQIKGYTAAEIIGQPFRVFYLPEEQEADHPERNLRMALEEGQHAEEGWRVRKDGSKFWASVVISPMYDDQGRHVGFAKVTRDQTDQRHHEQERQDLLAQQTQVMALTAHELRTPAAVIDGAAGQLRRSWSRLSEADRNEMFDSIHTSAQRLNRLSHDLTTASRLHADTLDVNREVVPLEPVLTAAIVRLGNLHPGVIVDLSCPPGLAVKFDELRIGQALDNLLANAVQHGVPPVAVCAEVDDDTVRICVTDSGTGIPAHLTPRLFAMFASAGRNRATGLGLYLVRQIARWHGGDATYEPPRDERGPTFVITLPRGT